MKSEPSGIKQSIYFNDDMLNELQKEAARLERSHSWVVGRAWRKARAEIRKLPGPDDGAVAGVP